MSGESRLTEPGAPPSGTRRFVPRARSAHAESFTVGVVVAVLFYAMSTYRGMGRVEGAGLSAVAGLVAYALYILRVRVRGLQEVDITDEALTVREKHGTRTLRWSEIAEARHTHLGGDRWIFHPVGDGDLFSLVLEGYTPEEVARINALIRAHLQDDD